MNLAKLINLSKPPSPSALGPLVVPDWQSLQVGMLQYAKPCNDGLPSCCRPTASSRPRELGPSFHSPLISAQAFWAYPLTAGKNTWATPHRPKLRLAGQRHLNRSDSAEVPGPRLAACASDRSEKCKLPRRMPIAVEIEIPSHHEMKQLVGEVVQNQCTIQG